MSNGRKETQQEREQDAAILGSEGCRNQEDEPVPTKPAKGKPIYSEAHGMWIVEEKIPGKTGVWQSFFYTKCGILQSSTFSEMSEDLRCLADDFDEMDKAGVIIIDSTTDGHYTFETTDPEVAKRFDFEWEPYECDEEGPLI
jgi:hypothetical protein